MELGELEQIIQLGIKYGLKSIQVGDCIAVLSPPDKPIELPKEGIERMPSDDEMLLYSTDAFDDVRSERDAALKPPTGG